MLKQIYKNKKSKISQKLEPIRQNQVHFRTHHPRFTLKMIQHLLPFEKKIFLLACVIKKKIFGNDCSDAIKSCFKFLNMFAK